MSLYLFASEKTKTNERMDKISFSLRNKMSHVKTPEHKQFKQQIEKKQRQRERTILF